jgi:putative transcriptional regulator
MNVTVNNRFGILLAEKQKEERRNIPLAEVSDATGVSRRALYAWENNSVRRFDEPIINALCHYFGLSPGELFEYVPDLPEQTKSKAAPK